jgi:uncharacterized protein YodC (DUF2158 family)
MTIQPSALKAGDIVRLKSDGPVMTIGVLTDSELICLWADSEEAIRFFHWFDCLPSPDLFEQVEQALDTTASIVAGCRVRLRSSRHPLMTVHSVQPSVSGTYQEANCFWFTRSQQLVYQLIPVGALQQIAVPIELGDN